MYGTLKKGPRYLEMAEGYVLEIGVDENSEIIGYKFVNMGKMMDAIKKGMDPKAALDQNIGTYGRFDEAVRVIDPVAHQELGIYLPLAAVNGLVVAFIYDDGFTGDPARGSVAGTALFGAVCTFATLAFIGFINGMFSTGEVFGLVNKELAASPIAIFGTPAGSLLVLALVAVFVNSIIAAVHADAADDAAAQGGER